MVGSWWNGRRRPDVRERVVEENSVGGESRKRRSSEVGGNEGGSRRRGRSSKVGVRKGGRDWNRAASDLGRNPS